VNTDDVLSAMRTNGLSDIDDADAVILVSDGTFSVIRSIQSGSTLDPARGYRGRARS
jgi:uncharacterized membrane protein YcaP (DUF421 family)